MNAGNGVAVNLPLTAAGGTGPYLWLLVGGTLPTNITLSSGGVLTGASTQGGVHTFTVRATDALGISATREFTLTIASAVQSFAATPTRGIDGTVTLTSPAVTGAWYQVETSDDLSTWTLLGNSVKAASTSMTWTDDGTQTGSHPSAAAKRFYRIHNWSVFDVVFTSNRFTYTDSQRTVTGHFMKPALSGRLPALLISTTAPAGRPCPADSWKDAPRK